MNKKLTIIMPHLNEKAEPLETIKSMYQTANSDLFQIIAIDDCSKEKMRYVMGVGSPEDLLNFIGMGVDTFDSVFPTRNARHGNIFTHNGAVNIENSQYRNDLSRLDSGCECNVCRKYTKSYMHHMFRTKEPLGLRLASYHNLYFIQDMLKNSRKAIKNYYSVSMRE